MQNILKIQTFGHKKGETNGFVRMELKKVQNHVNFTLYIIYNVVELRSECHPFFFNINHFSNIEPFFNVDIVFTFNVYIVSVNRFHSLELFTCKGTVFPYRKTSKKIETTLFHFDFSDLNLKV